MTHIIYQIYCLQNKRSYVGVTRNYIKRVRSHLAMLRRNEHHNKHLQHAYNKYGADQFVFIMLDACTSSQRDRVERKYIKQYKAYTKGFNHTQGGSGTLGLLPVNAKPCVWNGTEFAAISHAAKYKQVPRTTMRDWIHAGYTCDNDVKDYFK